MGEELKPCPCPFWDHEALAERLHKIGWRADCDAQWEHLENLCNEALLDCRFSQQRPRTVQAAPSDRERRLEAALQAYTQFEAELVMDRGSWSGPTGHPFRTDELLDQFMECQRLRNAALADTTTDEVQP